MSIPVPYKQNPHLTSDPLSGVWPAMLPFEIAMQPTKVEDICREYGLEVSDWEGFKRNHAFRAELKAAVEMLRKEGAAFRVRAQVQSLELLKKSWAMIHDENVPAAVRADLLKHTMRVAGLDASKDQGTFGKGGPAAAFQIILNLGGNNQIINKGT